MMFVIFCYKCINCIYFLFFFCWLLVVGRLLNWIFFILMVNFRYFRLFGDIFFSVKLMFCYWFGNNFNVDVIDVLKSNCCYWVNFLVLIGFLLFYVVLKLMFEIGIFNKLISEIWITLLFFVVLMDNIWFVKVIELLFRMKYFVFVGLNLVKIKVFCWFLMDLIMWVKVFVLFIMLVCCFWIVLSWFFSCVCCFLSSIILLLCFFFCFSKLFFGLFFWM